MNPGLTVVPVCCVVLARNRKKQMSRTNCDTTKLKEPLHKWNFSIVLKNRFEVLDSEDPRVDDA